MNLVVYANKNKYEEMALFDRDKKDVILMGDFYHNRINYKIEGYIKALRDFDIYDKNVHWETIDESHEDYGYIGFREYYNT